MDKNQTNKTTKTDEHSKSKENVFVPFKDNSSSTEYNGTTVENGTDKVAVWGAMDIDKSLDGLNRARFLAGIFSSAVAQLEAMEKTLPQKLDNEEQAPTGIQAPAPFG